MGRLKVGVFLLLVCVACSSGDADEAIQVSESGSGAFEAALAATPDGLVAAWYDVRDGNAEIYMRMLAPDGQPAGPERRLTSDPQLSYEADVQAIGPNVAVAWYDKDDSGRLQARLGVWTRDGAPVWTHAISSADRSGRNPTLAVHDSRLFVAWMEDSGSDASDVWAGWWNADGEPLSEPVLVGAAGRTTWNLNADVDGEGVGWIVYDARAGTRAEELFLARVDAEGGARWQLTPDDGIASKYPDIALSVRGEPNGKPAALTWHDAKDGNEEVYLAIATLAELAAGVEARARRVTNTPGHSIGAYAAWNGDTLGLAWCDDSDGGQHEIYFQPFSRDALPAAPPARLTGNATASLVPSIRAAATGFALAWNEYAAPAGDGHGTTGRSEIAVALVR